MNVYAHWQTQRDVLRQRLDSVSDLGQAVSHVRHALLQTEQNALAEIPDDVLRQQTGLLFACLKSSAGLLEVRVASQVWVPQKRTERPNRRALLPRLLSPALLLPLLVLFYTKGQWLGFALCAASVACALWALIAGSKASPAAQDEVRVTLRPDPDALLSALDEQMRAIDRQINDFLYLNEQLRGNAKCADGAALSRAADLLEALYECDPEQRAPAEVSARALLASLGLQALDYTEENSRLFNALPSKTETRTLSPAIVSAQDHRLLRRGTAAVRMGAA